ncbi:hypothetical protein [Niallia taxi]|nr:hypothetical protein [Niallia taxi]
MTDIIREYIIDNAPFAIIAGVTLALMVFIYETKLKGKRIK